MIGKLKGTIDSVDEDGIIIDVAGVGYKVFCSGKTLANVTPGSALELYIETHVREDHIHLYGFTSKDEQSSFKILQTVKGVGTRMALAILSALAPSQIQLALSVQDKTAFNNVSGVGKKLAERIIIELKDKFIAGGINISGLQGASAVISNAGLAGTSGRVNDAAAALVSLGINRSEAYSRVSQIANGNPELDTNELIRLALKSS